MPNHKNRSLIQTCIKKALKNTFLKVNEISEYIIETDSRNDIGTPDLVDSIFAKIDNCDIFICDISIVNSGDNFRLMPNPNVMIELGYAAKSLGWPNIICIFNKEFANIESLPFDIRSRKPLAYDSSEQLAEVREYLTKALQNNITDIFINRVSDKQFYSKTKKSLDLGMQAILLDFTNLYFSHISNAERFNYPRLLNITSEELEEIIRDRKYLGFHLFRNIGLHIDDFSAFVKDEVNSFFLSEGEKKILVKLIFKLGEYKEFLDIENLTNMNIEIENYVIASGHNINPDNSIDSYLLLEKLVGEKHIVRGGGNFHKDHLKFLLTYFSIPDKKLKCYCKLVVSITSLINDWITETGGYFIINEREIKLINH